MIRRFIYLVLIQPILVQELNIIPNILRPYFMTAEQLLPINLMANISEKLFHFQKMGIKFGRKENSTKVQDKWLKYKILKFDRTDDATTRL